MPSLPPKHTGTTPSSDCVYSCTIATPTLFAVRAHHDPLNRRALALAQLMLSRIGLLALLFGAAAAIGLTALSTQAAMLMLGVIGLVYLITRKVYPNVKSMAKKLTCPGVKPSSLGTIAGLPEDEWYAEEDAIDGQSSAYAGRDMKEHGLRKFPGKGFEPLVADDNDGGMNHGTETLVLFDDGTVQRMDIVTLADEGLLGEDEELIVGPDSQVEELRKLSLA